MWFSAWLLPESRPVISPSFSLTDMEVYLEWNAMSAPVVPMAMPTAGRSADVFLSSPNQTQLPLCGG